MWEPGHSDNPILIDVKNCLLGNCVAMDDIAHRDSPPLGILIIITLSVPHVHWVLV